MIRVKVKGRGSHSRLTARWLRAGDPGSVVGAVGWWWGGWSSASLHRVYTKFGVWQLCEWKWLFVCDEPAVQDKRR